MNRVRDLIHFPVLTTIVLTLTLSTSAADGRSQAALGSAAKSTQQDLGLGRRALININNISMWFARDGFSGHNPLTDNPGTTFPRSTSQIVFQDGLIWGGRVFDGNPQQVRVGGQTHRIGTVPGRILSRGLAQDPDDPLNRIYRIRHDYRRADLRLDAAELLGQDDVSEADVERVRDQYERDWLQWPWEWGAPYYDRDGDGLYDPQIDEPSFRAADCTLTPRLCASRADQVAFFAINDLDEGATTSLYGSRPIGMEVQVTLWAYARTGPLGDALFKKFTMLYKGTSDTPDDARIEDLYFAQWSDTDIGSFSNDFAGVDTSLSLAYGYNAEEEDPRYQAFELPPPAVGYDFLQGPIVPDPAGEALFGFRRRPGYRNLPMSSFVYFASGSAVDDPEVGSYVGTEEWYNLLRGFQPQPDVDNPVPYTNPLTGEDTAFTLDGDPLLDSGWTDGIPLPPGDRRIVLSAGPVAMALGDTQEVVVALLGALGDDRLRSITRLRYNDRFVQDAYDRGFDVTAPPATPNVRVAAEDQTIVLDWGHDLKAVLATEEGVAPPFGFQGYNVYQFPTTGADLAQARKLATYDVVDGVTTILGPQLDEASGVTVNAPLQIGRDSGLRWIARITRDALRNTPLYNGQPYYFGVTAYSHNSDPEALITSLESAPQSIMIVPQGPPPGFERAADFDAHLPVIHTRGFGDVVVQPIVVDPDQLIEATYTITFNNDGSWNLARDGVPVLEDQGNISLDERYLAVDGVQLKVGDPVFTAPATFDSVTIVVDADPADGDLDFWGDATVFDLADGRAASFWEDGGTDDPLLLGRDLEIRFTGVWDEDATHIIAGGSFATLAGVDPGSAERSLDAHSLRPPGSPASGPFLQRVPFEIWDVEDSAHPRQLNSAIYDRGADGSRDEDREAYHQTYNMGGRDYITVIATDYDAERIHTLTDSSTTWLLFFRQSGESVWSTGDVVRLGYASSIVPGEDEFQYTTAAPTFSAERARQDVTKVNVFPNPYYGVNEAETSRHKRFVTFNHLPSKAVIRLFDLSGNLVRILQKDDPDPFFQWDLNNDNALPVASGFYIAHIEMPEISVAKILKLAVIQEQQFLENF